MRQELLVHLPRRSKDPEDLLQEPEVMALRPRRRYPNAEAQDTGLKESPSES